MRVVDAAIHSRSSQAEGRCREAAPENDRTGVHIAGGPVTGAFRILAKTGRKPVALPEMLLVGRIPALRMVRPDERRVHGEVGIAASARAVIRDASLGI